MVWLTKSPKQRSDSEQHISLTKEGKRISDLSIMLYMYSILVAASLAFAPSASTSLFVFSPRATPSTPVSMQFGNALGVSSATPGLNHGASHLQTRGCYEDSFESWAVRN